MKFSVKKIMVDKFSTVWYNNNILREAVPQQISPNILNDLLERKGVFYD